MIKHLQELRALVYSIINNVLMGNSKLAEEYVKNCFPGLPKQLLRDVMIAPDAINRGELEYSENLSDESLDLLANLINVSELQQYLVGEGMTVSYLE